MMPIIIIIIIINKALFIGEKVIKKYPIRAVT